MEGKSAKRGRMRGEEKNRKQEEEQKKNMSRAEYSREHCKQLSAHSRVEVSPMAGVASVCLPTN